MAGLSDLEEFLRLAFGEELVFTLDGILDGQAFRRRLDELTDQKKEGTTLILVPVSCHWTEGWLDEATQRVERLKSRTSFIRVAFVADPHTLWHLIPEESLGHDSLVDKGADVLSLIPWGSTTVSHWLEDCGFRPSDPPTLRKVSAATGNWPALLQQLYQHSHSHPHEWLRELDTLTASLGARDGALRLAKSFGLDIEPAAKVLRDLAVLGDASTEDLAAVIDSVPSKVVTHALQWAQRLNLVQPVGNGRWQVDAIVRVVLDALRG